jgi:hypothetical protein
MVLPERFIRSWICIFKPMIEGEQEFVSALHLMILLEVGKK